MPATNELLQEGRYRIDHRATGSDDVFEAYDTVRNTPVIVREIPVKMNKVMTASQQESLKIAFTNQANALKEIRHDSLLPVHDYFSEIDRQYLVMETVEGQDLASVLSANKRPFPVVEITQWADELLDALHYIHSQKPSIIHRNIRPQNLKLSNGKVKLFGVGLDAGEDSGVSEDLRYSPMEQIWPGLDAASQKVITNSYDDRSERILKGPLDARSDIYSLGATLYFLATGVEPVDPLERSIDILEGKLDPLREPTAVNAQIPPEISDVLMKALEIKRENRYDSALIMRSVLQLAVGKVEEREEQEVAEQNAAADNARRAAEARFATPPAPATPPVFETPVVAPPPVEQVLSQPAREEVEFTEDGPTRADGLSKLPADAEVVAYRENEMVDEDELAAVLKELEEAEAKTSNTEPAPAAKTPVVEAAPEVKAPVVEERPAPAAKVSEPVVAKAEEPVVAKAEEPVVAKAEEPVVEEAEEPEVESFSKPMPVAASPSYADDEDEPIFSAEKAGFSLPMPAIAGAVGLVIVIAVGAWFAMSGSSAPEKPAPAPAETVQQSAPVETAPATSDPIASSQTDDPNAAAVTEPNQADAAAQKAAAAAKQKKAEPAKTPDKKKVTVDDLINDN